MNRASLNPLMLSLDLELNQPSNRIIQIGAVIGNITTGDVLDRISIMINPGEALSPEIIQLTGIQQADVDTAGDLLDGYRALVAWASPYTRQREALVWGGGDTTDLRTELGDRIVANEWVFSRRWLDVKTVFTAWRAANGKPWDGGLARAMTKLGLNFAGRKHNALADAENTFRLYVRLLEDFRRIQS